MRTELDANQDATMTRLTGEGGALTLGTHARGGVVMPMIGNAPATLADYFAHYCTKHAAATFLVSGEERLSFAQVHAAATRVAGALAARGVRKGDRVGIAMRNSPAWIALYMGTVMAGGVACLLNGWWRTGELAAAIGDVGCTLVFADGPRVERLRGVDVEVVAITDTLPLGDALSPLGEESAALPALTGDDLATILFTSGSTGQSKGAYSDHRGVVQGTFNFLAQALMMFGIATDAGTPPVGQPSSLLNLPLFHVTAEIAVLLQSFAMARKLVLMPKWDAEEAMRLIAAERITYFVGVPLMSFEMLTHPNRARYDLSSVTDFAAGGAARPEEHVRRLNEEMGGGAPLVGYGLTETNAVGTSNWRSNYLAKPGSAGRPGRPLMEIGILDDEGATLPPMQRGEIACRSVVNVLGYWNNDAATRAAFTADGWFRTGDLGYLDEDGYLFIVDRKKDIIIRGGENISCQEVEAALYEHPQVAEAAVFGLADERLGEVPAAVVRLARPGALDEAALTAFLREHIAAFKVPARLWFSGTALPRLGTEKIDKVAIRNEYRALAAAERA